MMTYEYYVYSSNRETSFSKLLDPLTFLNTIRKGRLTLEQAQNVQKAFNRYQVV